MIRRHVPGTLLLALAVCSAAAGGEPDRVLGEIRERYERIRDLQIAFVQQTAFAGSRVERRTEGTLLLKKEHKYRVETEDRLLVTDGATVWSWTPQTRQVLVDRYRPDAHGWTPERILTGAPGEYTVTALGRDRIAGRDVTGVKLVPRDDGVPLRSLKLWADPGEWLIRRAETEDLNGVTTVYTVTTVKVNAGLADTRFTYVIPDSADVVDLR